MANDLAPRVTHNRSRVVTRTIVDHDNFGTRKSAAQNRRKYAQAVLSFFAGMIIDSMFSFLCAYAYPLLDLISKLLIVPKGVPLFGHSKTLVIFYRFNSLAEEIPRP